MPKFCFLRRKFLEPASSHSSCYVQAEIESTFAGSHSSGTNRLVLANGGRRIELEFDLNTPRNRQSSLRKADLLAEIINSFVQKLRDEANLIMSASK